MKGWSDQREEALMVRRSRANNNGPLVQYITNTDKLMATTVLTLVAAAVAEVHR